MIGVLALVVERVWVVVVGGGCLGNWVFGGALAVGDEWVVNAVAWEMNKSINDQSMGGSMG